MRLLLDSSAYSLFMWGHEQVTELVRRAEEVLFSAIVVGELMYGFRRGTQFERNAAPSPPTMSGLPPMRWRRARTSFQRTATLSTLTGLFGFACQQVEA